MTNNTNGISIDMRINSENVDEVDSFKYLGAVLTDQLGFNPEVLSRLTWTTAALARLKTIWNNKHISESLSSKIRQYSLSVYLSTIVRLRNLDIDSGHPEEIAGH